MKQFTKRLLSSVIAIIFIVAAFVVFFNLVRPAYDSVQKMRGEQLSRARFIEDEKAIIGQVKKLVDDYRGEEKIQELVSLVLPLRADAAGALMQLSGLAEANHLTLQTVSVAAPALQNIAAEVSSQSVGGGEGGARTTFIKPIGLLNVQGRLVGTYGDFKAFLKQVETNVRIFDVKNINLQPAGKPNQDSYAYEVTITAYYQSR